MKRSFLFIVVIIMMVSAHAQLPQFSPQNFEGWVYNNPVTELNQSNIVNNKIYLYRTSTGVDFTLTSPVFSSRKGQTIDMQVTWVTDQWQSSHFVVRKVALTAALLDESGVAVDSVTFTPVSVNRTNYVNLSLTVPSGLTAASLRFAAWDGDVNSSGAVRQIKITSFLRGDVNLDGEVTVADANAVVDVILSNAEDQELRRRADVNGDGEVGLADINSVIDIVVG